MGFLAGGTGTVIRHDTQITHTIFKQKHSTQNYTNKEGHTIHNEYNKNTTTTTTNTISNRF
jgi:hypothetical protein